MPKPIATEVNLSAEEQEGLEQLVRRHNVGQQIALRGRIILAAGEGQTNSAIARQFGISINSALGFALSERSYRGDLLRFNRWRGDRPIDKALREIYFK